MRHLLILIFATILIASCKTHDLRGPDQPFPREKNEKVIASIKKKMQEQEDCWNKGDIPCFMKHYWKSDSLKFVGKSGINYGWQKTLDNYLISYPDASTMGKLTFTNEVIEFVDVNTVQVIGKWHLKRSDELGDLSGYYSLLWKMKEGSWVIISDHSS